MSEKPKRALRRIGKELEHMQSYQQYCEVTGDVSDDYRWNLTFKNQDESKFTNGEVTANMDFPEEYPFKPPTITFTRPINHPNVTGGMVDPYVFGNSW